MKSQIKSSRAKPQRNRLAAALFMRGDLSVFGNEIKHAADFMKVNYVRDEKGRRSRAPHYENMRTMEPPPCETRLARVDGGK